VHLVLAHPEKQTFSGHLANISAKVLGTTTYAGAMSDLYAMDFDPRASPQHYSIRKDTPSFSTLMVWNACNSEGMDGQGIRLRSHVSKQYAV
jgi:putative NADPH-quinone reductase